MLSGDCLTSHSAVCRKHYYETLVKYLVTKGMIVRELRGGYIIIIIGASNSMAKCLGELRVDGNCVIWSYHRYWLM